MEAADGDGLAPAGRDFDAEPPGGLTADCDDEMVTVTDLIMTRAPAVGDVAFSAFGLLP